MPIKIKEILATRKLFSENQKINDYYKKQNKIVGDWVNSIAENKASILEVGCGSCKVSKHIHCRYVGIDPIRHDEMEDDAYFSIGSGESIPYPDSSFNFILIKDSINYFSDIDPVLIECARVLDRNGSLLITEHVGNKFTLSGQIVRNFIKKFMGIGRSSWDTTIQNYHSAYALMRSADRLKFKAEFNYSSEDSRYYLQLKI